MTEDKQAEDIGDGPKPYVSTAPPTGAAAAATGTAKKKAKKKPDKSSPWRDNIEAIAVSIVTIVLFKYFVVEAYKIPTGSMQPTLMGNSETGIYDRVLVDKLSYHFRDPDRFEVVVFKYPLEQSKNYIKRIVGMPGEQMRLSGGDIQVRPSDDDEWEVLRRPRPIQEAQLRRIRTGGEWKRYGHANVAWSFDSNADGESIVAKGTGRMTYPEPAGSIKNEYLDGYPESMAKIIAQKMNPGRAKSFGRMNVSDVRARFQVTASAGTQEVKFVVHEGNATYSFRLPGPSAPEGDVARIEVSGSTPPGDGDMSAASPEGLRLTAGTSVQVEVQNLNDLLSMRIDGEEICTLEVRPAADGARAWVDLAVEAPKDSTVQIDDLRLWRDLYYISSPTGLTQWTIPDDSYVVLGDNSQDSSDGRDWRLAQYRIDEGPDAGTIVQGGKRGDPSGRGGPQPPDANPKRVYEGVEEPLQFFTNELGERRVDRVEDVTQLDAEYAPFVPRDLVRGRAVLVVWPLARKGVYRLKWVR